MLDLEGCCISNSILFFTHRHLPVTDDIVGQDAADRDSPPSPSLAKLLLKTDPDAPPCGRQQHFDSGGGGLLHMDGGDSWGSISKMLHQRYNSGGSSADPAVATGERFVICDVPCKPGVIYNIYRRFSSGISGI